MQKQVLPLRKSTSLIVMRERHGTLEYLMMTRKSTMSFASGCVFPGGVCQKEDRFENGDSFLEYGKLTALRETLEEAGILLLPQQTDATTLNLKSTDSLSEVIKRCWSKQNRHLLLPMLRLLTIHMPGKRYDCIFYIPSTGTKLVNYRQYLQKGVEGLNDLDNLIPDSESVSYFWSSAPELLNKLMQGQILLFPPQIIILTCLKDFKSIEELSAAARTIQDVDPILLDKHGEIAFLPYDKEYNSAKIIAKEPESESKRDLIEFLEQTKRSLAGKETVCRFRMDPSSVDPIESTYKRTMFLNLLKPRPKL